MNGPPFAESGKPKSLPYVSCNEIQITTHNTFTNRKEVNINELESQQQQPGCTASDSRSGPNEI
jgi:hypothetical protein